MINLGTKIRELRKKRDISQEVLAEALCVSFQAVSKWETGTALPDVTLVPAIASFFGVSTDELFDYDRFKTEQKLEEIVTKAAEIRADRPAEAEKIIRDGLRQFPGNEILLNNLLYTIDSPERRDEALNICKSLVEAASDDAVKYDALRIMAGIYSERGDEALCEETLEKIPEIYFTKLELAAGLLCGEKSFKAARSQLALNLDSAVEMLAIIRRHLSESGDRDGAEKAKTAALSVVEIIKSFEPKWYDDGCRELCEKLLAD